MNAVSIRKTTIEQQYIRRPRCDLFLRLLQRARGSYFEAVGRQGRLREQPKGMFVVND
jgi:hypothetical protein